MDHILQRQQTYITHSNLNEYLRVLREMEVTLYKYNFKLRLVALSTIHFDFDGTLFNSQEPKEGRAICEIVRGETWPQKAG